MNFIPIDRKQMKTDAKAAMRAHRPSVYLVAIVFLLITLLLTRMNVEKANKELREQRGST